ncbi:MAG: 2-amino-4-hydroxy-6-hydroxymethyldihydropteridine diphosphokinase [Acidimicrobiales bacterium]
MRAFLGLGSNLGDRLGYLRAAVADLPDLVAVSPLYESAPVGGPEQGAYLNIVVQLDTRQLPHELLETCRRLERAAGRERVVRWGPRTLDVDVLWIDGVRVGGPELTVPHPRMHERNFVMDPLLDLDPSFEHPHYDRAKAYGEVTRVGPL